jgi:hypothetical protein
MWPYIWLFNLLITAAPSNRIWSPQWFNPLNHDIRLTNIQKFSSYVTRNTISITGAKGLMFLTTVLVSSSLVSHTCHITCTFRPSWFENRIDIWRGVQTMKFLLRSYFAASCSLHVLQHLSLNTYSLKPTGKGRASFESRPTQNKAGIVMVVTHL